MYNFASNRINIYLHFQTSVKSVLFILAICHVHYVFLSVPCMKHSLALLRLPLEEQSTLFRRIIILNGL